MAEKFRFHFHVSRGNSGVGVTLVAPDEERAVLWLKNLVKFDSFTIITIEEIEERYANRAMASYENIEEISQKLSNHKKWHEWMAKVVEDASKI